MKKFKKMVSALAMVAILSATTVTSANATYSRYSTKTGTTSLGYSVASTASYSGKNIMGEGQVTGGAPCSINLYVEGYERTGNNRFVLSCSAGNSTEYGTYLSASGSDDKNIGKVVCTATFSGEKVTATVI